MRRLIVSLLIFCFSWLPAYSQQQAITTAATPAAGIQHIGSCSGGTGGATTVVSGSCVVAAGDAIIVAINTSGAGTSVSTVCNGTGTNQCTGGDTFTQVVTRQFQSGAGGGEFWVKCGAAGATATVTAAFSGSVSADIDIHIVRGLAASSCFDKSAHASGNNAVPSSGNTAMLTVANEYVMGLLGWGGAVTFTEASGFTSVLANTFPSNTAYKIVAATTAVAYAPTLSGAGTNWNCTVATFK